MATWTPANALKIREILNNLKNNVYDFEPEYQRSFHGWNDNKRNDLLNSIIDGYPVPALYVIEKDGKQVVIDGKQRITAVDKLFSENSEMLIGDQIKVKSLKPFFEFYTNTDDGTVIVYNFKKYCCKENNEKFSKMNLNQFLKMSEKFYENPQLRKVLQHDDNLYAYLLEAHNLCEKIKIYSFYYSKGEDCTEDDETTLFGYLNAGESLTNSEELNGKYWNYELWRQAKHFSNEIRIAHRDMWEALFGKFRDKDRYQDIEFWADIFLTLYHKKAVSTRLNIRRWKDIRSENHVTNAIDKADKLEEHKIRLCKSILNKFYQFVTWEGVADDPNLKLKDDKKTYKVLLALFLVLYVEKEKRPDVSNYLKLRMDRANNLYRVINKGIKQMSYQELLNTLLSSVNLNN